MSLQDASLQELSLLAVLRAISTYCHTSMGSDAVCRLSEQIGAHTLPVALSQVQEMVHLITMHETVPFERFPDVTVLLKRSKIAGNYLTAPELLNVLECMVSSRILRRYLTAKEESAEHLAVLASRLADDRVLEKHITDAIDETGLVRDTASRELMSIRREIHSLEARLRARLQKILRKFDEEELLQDDFITQRDGRFVLPLQVQNKRSVEGIIHGISQSGQTVFLEPAETYELNNELSILRGREQREIISILTTLTAEIGGVSQHLEDAVAVLTELDSLQARARYAIDFGGIKPMILSDGAIELTNVRHPILVHQARAMWNTELPTQSLDKAQQMVIPMSVRIDSTTRGILISGPNAGGKTVAMKTIGLSLAMAYCGIFPLGTCSAPIMRLYTSIGDHQSIDANLSTFSSQIVRLRDVLAEVDSQALVLIDEICAGTDPAEGGALAAGILDSLFMRGAGFVVTTHQSSLKQYALTRDGIANASLAFDQERMVPIFRFLFGVPGNSYAFDLARTVGLPDVVLRKAKEYMSDRHTDLEKSISVMQRYKEEAEQLRAKAAVEFVASEKVRTDYEDRLTRLKAKGADLAAEARQQAAQILADANSLIEKTIREIREREKNIGQVKREFVDAKRELLASVPSSTLPASTPTPSIVVGCEVRIAGTSTTGVVLTTDDKDHAVVDVNGITMRTSISKLELVSTPQTISKQSASTSKKSTHHATISLADPSARTPPARIPSLTLDMRGMRAEEALHALENFVDNAVVSNAPFVSIIHGKGTGALREVVHQFLETHNGVGSFRLGSIPEGGDGITIVEFR